MGLRGKEDAQTSAERTLPSPRPKPPQPGQPLVLQLPACPGLADSSTHQWAGQPGFVRPIRERKGGHPEAHQGGFISGALASVTTEIKRTIPVKW